MNEERKQEKGKRCCLCDGIYVGYGNNPAPIKNEGRCCDGCNITRVIPARVLAVKHGEKI